MIVLDTHVLIWWINGSAELSRKARQRIDAVVDTGGLLASSISCWEIGLLVAKGRLDLTIPAQQWIARCESLPFLTFVPVDNTIALAATSLSGRAPRDPADRMIIATARAMGASIVTKDERIRAYDIPTVW